jgi:CheY-like chemotaxis protein
LSEGSELGLEFARHLDPEVVLCDLELPGIDGLEVYEQLEARHREVFVLWTGRASGAGELNLGPGERGEDAGELGFRVLSKPLPTEELLEAVEREIDRVRSGGASSVG